MKIGGYAIQSQEDGKFLAIYDGHFTWTTGIEYNTKIFESEEHAIRYWNKTRMFLGWTDPLVDIRPLDVSVVSAA